MCWIGHRLLSDVELDVDPTLSLADAHTAERTLISTVPRLTAARVHAYPAADPKRTPCLRKCPARELRGNPAPSHGPLGFSCRAPHIFAAHKCDVHSVWGNFTGSVE